MIVRRLRRWARGHTRRRRYSPVGVAFHWTVATLVFFQLAWGWRTGRLPAGYDKVEAYVIHGQVGFLLLGLTLLRMAWRLAVPGPINDADKPGWQSTAAHVTHGLLYACLLILPLSGWAMLAATAPDLAERASGAMPWTALPLQDLRPVQRWTLELWSERIHFGAVILLLVLLPLHIAATAQHHVLHRHDVLEGMLPGLTRTERRILKALRRKPRRSRSPRPSSAG